MTTEVLEMKQFQLYVPPTSKSYTENDDGTLTIEGIASTTNKDLQGDIILPSAIHSMKQQLLTTTKNLHGDHFYGLDGIYGAIKEVLESDDDTLMIRAVIRKSKAQEIKEMLDVGVNLGLSIGGKISEYIVREDGWDIEDLKLMEISLTGMPANWDTYGTIQESVNNTGVVGAKCLAGACHVIRKSFGDVMTENDKNTQRDETTEVFTKEDAVDLFNELMSNKQEEIVRETIDEVNKELRNIITEEINKVTGTSEQENNDEEETEDDEEKNKALSELIEETVNKALNNTIAESVNKAMETNLQNLFKDLKNNRNPEFRVDEIKPTSEQETMKTDKSLTSKEIAKQIYANQSQEEIIRNLIN